MQIEDMSRQEILEHLNLTTDEVIEHFGRDTVLSALGLYRPMDFLDEVTLEDVIAYYNEGDIAERINLEDYWDSDDAYNRYGSDLLEHFDIYDYISDTYTYDDVRDNWSAEEVCDAYGDDTGLLGHLFDTLSVKHTVGILVNHPYVMLELVNSKPEVKLNVSFKQDVLTKLLKAQREVLQDAVRDF
jgi:hypothetical protein